MVGAIQTRRPRARSAQGGQEQSRQHGQHRHHHHEFNEGETNPADSRQNIHIMVTHYSALAMPCAFELG
jgi:hypothetical protein